MNKILFAECDINVPDGMPSGMAGDTAGGIWLGIPGYIGDPPGVGMGIDGPAGGYYM